jgi:glutaredoxin
MASKKFAYYNKGNKIGLVEKSPGVGSGGRLAVAHCTISGYSTKDTCEAAGGQWIPGSSGSLESYGKYLSPTEDVANGLEIEYTYAPIYNLQSTGTEGTDFIRFIGWGSDGSNLIFFTFSGASSVVDLSSNFSANDWIYVEGSGRWSGLHQIASDSSNVEPYGIIRTKTKCNLNPSTISVTGTFEADDETFIGDNDAHKLDIETFKDNIESRRTSPYIFITQAAHGSNSGLFKLSSNSTSGKITLGNKISIDADGDYTDTASSAVDGGNDAIDIYNAVSEQITIYKSIEVMEDESFNLDITRYQGLAIIDYLRSKMAEQMGNMELALYYLARFRKQVEKGASSRKYGPRIIQGHGMTRK